VGVGDKSMISVTDTNDECSVEKLSEFKGIVLPFMAKLDISASSEQFE